MADELPSQRGGRTLTGLPSVYFKARRQPLASAAQLWPVAGRPLQKGRVLSHKGLSVLPDLAPVLGNSTY